MFLLELKGCVTSNSSLFWLKPYKGNTSQKQDRDIRSLLKHSVQENSQEKERKNGQLNWMGTCTTHSFILSPWSTSHSWHCFLQNVDFEKSAWHRPVEQLIPVGRTFVSNTEVVADVLSGPPTAVSWLCSTAKPVVSLLQLWIVSTWIYLPGCASSLADNWEALDNTFTFSSWSWAPKLTFTFG